MGLLALAAVALLIPLVAQLTLAGSFLSGKIARLDVIAEMRSPWSMARKGGFWVASEPYSLLLWVLPFTVCYCAVQGWRERASGRVVFWITALFGIAMLLMQFRLHYFGSFALIVPLLVLAERVTSKWPDHHKQIMLCTSLLFALAYWPPLGYVLGGHNSPAGDGNFAALRPILGSLQRACARDPGIVLADNDAGHYIRYYTDCSVIANNFLLTPQHEQKIQQIDYLTSRRAVDLPRVAPYVKYILLRPATIFREENGGARYMTYSPKSAPLFGDLLLKQIKDVPSDYTLIDQANIGRTGETPLPYIRLYSVRSSRPVAN